MFLYKLQNNELNFTPLFETQLKVVDNDLIFALFILLSFYIIWGQTKKASLCGRGF